MFPHYFKFSRSTVFQMIITMIELSLSGKKYINYGSEEEEKNVQKSFKNTTHIKNDDQ